jgi:hypothetical protein
LRRVGTALDGKHSFGRIPKRIHDLQSLVLEVENILDLSCAVCTSHELSLLV